MKSRGFLAGQQERGRGSGGLGALPAALAKRADFLPLAMGVTNRKKWMLKPFRNWPGIVPKPLMSQRRVKIGLLPRVQRLVAGGAIPKPLWLDAVLAHPPPFEHLMSGEPPRKLEWREDDRLRRIWQRRNPEASMHPKVLFLDESQLPPSAIEHPADVFVKRQQALMRRGLSEDEAYRRVLEEDEDAKRVDDAEVAAAQAKARAMGASPAAGGMSPPKVTLAEQLLRRFAEEARDSSQPYPRHWFNADGTWRGIGESASIDSKTTRALGRAGAPLADMFAQASLAEEELESRPEEDDDDEPEPTAQPAAEGQPVEGGGGGEGGERPEGSAPK